jgi:hypothetical protein
MRIVAAALMLSLAGCHPNIWVDSNKYGQPRVILFGGFGNELQEGILTAENGKAKASMILRGADGTKVINTISGDIVTAKGVDAYYDNDNIKTTTDGKVKINQSNNDLKGKVSDNAKEEVLGTFEPAPK